MERGTHKYYCNQKSLKYSGNVYTSKKLINVQILIQIRKLKNDRE